MHPAVLKNLLLLAFPELSFLVLPTSLAIRQVRLPVVETVELETNHFPFPSGFRVKLSLPDYFAVR